MLNALLNTASIWTTAAGIVGSFGAGASYAGYKTLKLTEPIKEFLLEPLHMPRVRNVVYDKAGWKKYTNEVFQENENDREDIDEDKDTLVVDNSQTHNGVPVYILISGHIPDGIDARNIWGADGVTANGFRFFDPENHTEMDSKVMTDQNVFKTSVVETEVVKTLTTDSGRIEVFLAKNVINIEDEWEELFPDQDAATSGWWRDLFPHGEEYILNWDRTVLEKLNDSFQKMLKDKICGMVKEEIMKFTPFHGPISAIKGAAGFPLHVWGSIKSIDDPWLVAMDRARQAGILLARVLLAERKNKKIVGNLEKGVNEIRIDTADVDNFKNLLFSTGRPITLVGYGMGARVILHCLETLYNEGQVLDSVTGTSINIALGIIENAVLIGAPVSSSFKVWSAARAVVAGRLINCFSSNDWLLAYLYRCKSYDLSVAGLAPVRLKSKPVSGYFTKRLPLSEQKYLILDDCNDVENVNISHLVKSHSDYADALPHVMKLLHL